METSSAINQARLPRISPLAGPRLWSIHSHPPAKSTSFRWKYSPKSFRSWRKRGKGMSELDHKNNLMLVCRHWYAVMLSTPGIPSTLRIRRATQKEVIQTFLQARTRWLIDVIVDMNDEKMGMILMLITFMHPSWPQPRQHLDGALLGSFHLHLMENSRVCRSCSL
jgi:hypothetical protein